MLIYSTSFMRDLLCNSIKYGIMLTNFFRIKCYESVIKRVATQNRLNNETFKNRKPRKFLFCLRFMS